MLIRVLCTYMYTYFVISNEKTLIIKGETFVKWYIDHLNCAIFKILIETQPYRLSHSRNVIVELFDESEHSAKNIYTGIICGQHYRVCKITIERSVKRFQRSDSAEDQRGEKHNRGDR